MTFHVMRTEKYPLQPVPPLLCETRDPFCLHYPTGTPNVRVSSILPLIKRNMKIGMFRTVPSQSVPSAFFHRNEARPPAV